MVARCAIVLLTPPSWAPPGIDPAKWRHALAGDVVDLLTALAEVDVAVAATEEGMPLAEDIRWPGMKIYHLPPSRSSRNYRNALNSLDSFSAQVTGRPPRPRRPHAVAALAAAAADGYDQGLVLAADSPDLPALLVGKMLRPLTSRPVAAAPVLPDRLGLVGLASRLPAPDWLTACDPDLDNATVDTLRAAAHAAGVTNPSQRVAACPGWHRLRSHGDLGLLDVGLEGWDATRALLSRHGHA